MYSSIFLQWASKIFLLLFKCNYQNFRFEWHPFTISSAPEKRDVFSVHIRAAGGWTNALYNYVQGENNKWSKIIRSTIERNKVAPDQAWYQKNLIEPTKLKVFIDGPHSAPSSTIFSSEHAVLVATGIGVTPFASILQSIVAKYENIGFFIGIFWWIFNQISKEKIPWKLEASWFYLGEQRLSESRLVSLDVERSREVVFLHLNMFISDSIFRSVFDNILNVQLFVTSAPSGDNYDTLSLSLALELLYKVDFNYFET